MEIIGTEEEQPEEGQSEEKQPEEMTKETESEESELPSDILQEDKISMRNFLKTAFLPVGNTMYIWGGGWNEADTGAGIGATTIGLHPQWAEFAASQTDDYNAEEHRYEILNGLDCSGYIGWLVYNVMETESGKPGYVYKSTDIAGTYSELGWGEYIEAPEEFLTGDIVSMKGHVWLALGTCEDGSVVLLHASPPGVSLCGTALADGGESEAVRLARQYMEAYAPDWQEKYPNRAVSHSYLNVEGVFRWNEDVMPLAEQYRNMKVEEVLDVIERNK